jgi:hypothetical protein
VARFTPRSLYPRGKSPRYPLDRRPGGLHSRSGRGSEEKHLCPYRESNLRHHYNDWLTRLIIQNLSLLTEFYVSEEKVKLTFYWDSSVITFTGYGFLHSVHTGSGSPLPPPPIQWVPGSLSPRIKQSGLTSCQCRGYENVDLYLHSPTRFHVVVLN